MKEEPAMRSRTKAIMAQRNEAADSLDDFPTPPWATRALAVYVLPRWIPQGCFETVWEPACGRGYMTAALEEYGYRTVGTDIADYPQVSDRHKMLCLTDFTKLQRNCFWIELGPNTSMRDPAAVITNPPFRLAEKFIDVALSVVLPIYCTAMLLRTSFLEGVGRYSRLFSCRPPTEIWQFYERVPMAKGRLAPEIRSATAHAWFVWGRKRTKSTAMRWIPPCRAELEKDGDYPDG